jgi:methionyl-tRNA formyltransferase
MVLLCAKHLPSIMAGTHALTPQPREGASYYPKRGPEDGLVYWSDHTADIYNLIRAVTRPFPGAFSYLDDDPAKKVILWRAIPFDGHLDWSGAEPGEVVEAFHDHTFVIKTGDTSLLVLECEGHPLDGRDVGRRFGHLDTPRKTWQLPA